MKRVLTFAFILFTFLHSFANNKDSVIYYRFPDSVKAVQFMAEIKVHSYNKKKFFSAGIKTDTANLTIQNYYGSRRISFYSHAYSNSNIRGLNVRIDRKDRDMIFDYNWEINETYKLLISQATDSVGNFSLYSGYIFLPKENKWKLIGTLKIEGRRNTIQQPAFFYRNGKKQDISVTTGQVWCQRQNGSWKNMLQKDFAPPVVNLYSHVDSLEQLQIDKKLITQAIDENKTDAKQDHDGVYYTIMKEGTGRQVSVNDTVTVFYKGYLFNDNSIFDGTKDKPAIFPLKRLIVGWQIGVPLCKVGGKIKIIIPSNLAYSIRTRSAKIPPNSILVFEIEVVDAKAPQ
ncbi:MAG TPA: FKBP-type peptidyl-prolyl cis-trans isomerase [Chitinophagaceae bacterium]|nr:FKBP-type peptidyl-prolyl cis-trans isomerase [Chitinophagaceae bacterium]